MDTRTLAIEGNGATPAGQAATQPLKPAAGPGPRPRRAQVRRGEPSPSVGRSAQGANAPPVPRTDVLREPVAQPLTYASAQMEHLPTPEQAARLNDEIDVLRARIAKLGPAEEAIEKLTVLRMTVPPTLLSRLRRWRYGSYRPRGF